MKPHRFIKLGLFAPGLFVAVALAAPAAPQQRRQDQRPAVGAQMRPNPGQIHPPNAGRGPGQGGAPGPQLVDRLAKMKPEAREQALANLPPERRDAVMRRLDAFEAMPPGARDQARLQVERLRSLPPMRQNQVRRSLRQLQTLPDDRKAEVGTELERLRAMPQEERLERMKSDDFASRYSKPERQMVENLSEILPKQ